MRNIVRIVSFLLVTCLVIGMFAGCSDETTNRAMYEMGSTDCVNSGIMAENSTYTLEWDNDYKCIVVKNKQTGLAWSTTPYDLYSQGEKNTVISSPVEINVIDAVTKTIDFDRAYSACIRSGNMSAEKIDNGVKVTYYFDDYQIALPICYILRDDSFAITLDPKNITEGEQFKLLNVSIAPFLCAAQNDIEDNYLFVPSGTGALINASSLVGKKTTYSFDLYGAELNRINIEQPIQRETLRLPVFGAKNGSEAVMGIIEQGAETAQITTTVGDKKNGYSNVYPTIWVRGYDSYKQSVTGVSSAITIVTRNSELMMDENVVIGYYALSGEKANYTGMAECYRDYLVEQKGLKKSSVEENIYALSVLGNITTKKLFVGIPYKTTTSLTTFKEAQAMISDIASATGKYPTVQMVGYGESGVDVGKIAGGFKLASVAGSLKDYAEIEKLAKDNGFLLSVDFELLKFKESSNGISSSTDTAKSASKSKAKQQYVDFALRWYSTDYPSYYLIKRSKLSEIVDTLIGKADKLGISGISASSLGQIAYSDYFDVKYISRANTEKDVTEYLSRIKAAGYKVVTDDANAYAAVVSDSVLNLEIEPYNMDGINEYVPFYQMVFKGYIPLYSEALNLSVNYNEAILSAVATGTGFGFTVMEKYNPLYSSSPHTNMYNSLYSDIKDEIETAVDTYAEYYEAIKGAKILGYTVSETGVTTTTFDNGVVAYTNPTDAAQESPAGELSAYGFKYTK